MPNELVEFRRALNALIDSAHRCVRGFGCDLVVPMLDLQLVSAGNELVRTDYKASIQVAVSSVDQLAPPPQGGNVIYGVCHEFGHLMIAHTVAPFRLPPVVWDEAIAHVLALDLLLPAVWEDHGPDLWPVPYPDYLEREVACASSGEGSLMSAGYAEMLSRQTIELRDWMDAAGGPAVLLDALASVASTNPSPVDWRWKLRGRLMRASGL